VESRLGQGRGAVFEEPEALKGVHCVHRTLQGKMDVEMFDESERLVDKKLPFFSAQHSLSPADAI
jgi:hypothetical protein